MQLVRIRTWPHISKLTASVALAAALLAVAAMADSAWVAAGGLALLAVILIGLTLRDCAFAAGLCRRAAERVRAEAEGSS
jgi:hypothetical protein